jgi:hypothetical protein
MKCGTGLQNGARDAIGAGVTTGNAFIRGFMAVLFELSLWAPHVINPIGLTSD